VLLVDVEPAMVERSVSKIGAGRPVVADAVRLPFRDRSFDRAMIVTALHLLRPAGAALAEARRVLREGPLAVLAFTEENLRSLFVLDYFAGSEIRPAENPPAEVLTRWLRDAGFSEVRWEPFVYRDAVDGTLVSLHASPAKLASPQYLRNTSFFHRLSEGARREGLRRLAADLRSGALARKAEASLRAADAWGHGTLFTARV
jgi:SAM-dependent methyltransferase